MLVSEAAVAGSGYTVILLLLWQVTDVRYTRFDRRSHPLVSTLDGVSCVRENFVRNLFTRTNPAIVVFLWFKLDEIGRY